MVGKKKSVLKKIFDLEFLAKKSAKISENPV
jgi:hypothetical protein